MTKTDDLANFAGSIPEHYDTGLGPHIFVDYGAALAELVATARPASLLELAAGTGIVSRMLRDALPAAVPMEITDLSPAMLTAAQGKFGTEENVCFQPADATDLPFDDRSFDTVACQFGVMFFPDKDLAYREAHRVLKPGGHYVFNVWGSLEHNPFARIAHECISQFFPDDPPAFYQLPFGYHDVDAIVSALSNADFGDIEVHRKDIKKAIPDAARFATGLVRGNPTIDEINSRANASPDEVIAALTTALQDAFGRDPGTMPLQAIAFRAQKP